MHLYNLTWPQAREVAEGGRRVRRVGWLDRWLVNLDGALWWIEQVASGDMAVVTADDFTRLEFLASDWTTVAPDQHACVWPPEPDPEDPPPPVIPPDPEPPGEPVSMQITHASDRGAGKRGTIANPLPVGVRVVCNGTAAVSFWINGLRASSRIASNYDTVNYSFLLSAGRSFNWEIRGQPGGWCGGTVTFHFNP